MCRRVHLCIQQFIECDTGQSSKTEGVGECKKLTEIEEVSFELQSEEEEDFFADFR